MTLGPYDTIDYSIPEFPQIFRGSGTGLVMTQYWQDPTSGDALENNPIAARNTKSQAKIIKGAYVPINSNADILNTIEEEAHSDSYVLFPDNQEDVNSDTSVLYPDNEQTVLSDAEIYVSP